MVILFLFPLLSNGFIWQIYVPRKNARANGISFVIIKALQFEGVVIHHTVIQTDPVLFNQTGSFVITLFWLVLKLSLCMVILDIQIAYESHKERMHEHIKVSNIDFY